MKVEITPKDLLNKIMKEKYDNRYKTYKQYGEEFEVFYKNLEDLTKKEYKGGDTIEINDDIKNVNSKSHNEIKGKGINPRCQIMICDNLFFYKEELEKHFKSYPSMDFAKPQNYLPKTLGFRLNIALTCVDTEYEPL